MLVLRITRQCPDWVISKLDSGARRLNGFCKCQYSLADPEGAFDLSSDPALATEPTAGPRLTGPDGDVATSRGDVTSLIEGCQESSGTKLSINLAKFTP
jgi:hypothetical protein